MKLNKQKIINSLHTKASNKILEFNTRLSENKMVEIIIDWASEFKGLDKKLSKKYGINIVDGKRMEATVSGDAKKIKKFLLSPDYDLDIDTIKDLYPELN